MLEPMGQARREGDGREEQLAQHVSKCRRSQGTAGPRPRVRARKYRLRQILEQGNAPTVVPSVHLARKKVSRPTESTKAKNQCATEVVGHPFLARKTAAAGAPTSFLPPVRLQDRYRAPGAKAPHRQVRFVNHRVGPVSGVASKRYVVDPSFKSGPHASVRGTSLGGADAVCTQILSMRHE